MCLIFTSGFSFGQAALADELSFQEALLQAALAQKADANSNANADANANTNSQPAGEPVAFLPPPQTAKHQIDVSGDIFYGLGDVFLPVGVAFDRGGHPGIVSPLGRHLERNTLIGGTTVSYSPNQVWFFDFHYSTGSSESSGNIYQNVPAVGLANRNRVSGDDYQAYVRYAFPTLRTTRAEAYVKLGISYSPTEFSAEGGVAGTAVKSEAKSHGLSGNLGFGLKYAILQNTRWRMTISGEGEGFGGFRWQRLTETADTIRDQTDINKYLLGGLGRLTLRAEYHLGRSGYLRAFVEAGMEGRFTIVRYHQSLGDQSEVYWGPSGKLGLLFAF